MFSKSTIKYIQSLQHKKFRDEHNQFIAEGPKLVEELLEGNLFNCTGIFALDSWAPANLPGIKNRLGEAFTIIKDFELEKITSLSKPNQVLALFEKKAAKAPADISKKITLVLDDIQDPGNLGTIIRLADWFAIENIICSPHTADAYNSKVVQSTMASLGRINIFYTNIEEWLVKNKAVKSYAAVLDGELLKPGQSIKEGILIIGNESKGIQEKILALVDEKITIPRLGHAESLNAAVATAILVYSFTG